MTRDCGSSAAQAARASVRFGAVAGAARRRLARSSAGERSPSSAPTARARPRCCACCTACSRTTARVARRSSGRPRAGQAMVFQRPFLLRLSVLEQPALALWLARGAAAERAERGATQALQRVGLADLRHRPARALSGGQQQRLALARAWAVRPRPAVPRRADRQPRPRRQAGGRAPDRRVRRRRHDARDEHAQPRPGQAPGHARGLPGRRPRRSSTCRRRRFFDRALPEPAASFVKGELAWRIVKRRVWIAPAAAAGVHALVVSAQERFIVMASTTSTEQSGLFAHLLPAFKAASGIDVRVVARGHRAGAGLRRGAATPTWSSCTTSGRGEVRRRGLRPQAPPVMYNDFVLVGPQGDPAGVKGKDIVAALAKLAGQRHGLRLARRQERHACRRAALLEDGRHRLPPRRTQPATRSAAAAWARR